MNSPILSPGARLPLVLAGFSLIGVLYQEIYHNDRDMNARVSKLEAHQSDDSERLNRIESKLDRFMEYMGIRLQNK